jgi:hypothetical protein
LPGFRAGANRQNADEDIVKHTLLLDAEAYFGGPLGRRVNSGFHPGRVSGLGLIDCQSY